MSLNKKKWLIVINASDFGGAENEVIQLAMLMQGMGVSPEICTRYRLDMTASICQYTAKESVYIFSPIEFFWKTVKGRAYFILAFLRYLFTQRKLPTYRQQSRFGEHVSKTFRESFWRDKRTKEILKKYGGVIFFGEPIAWFEELYMTCENLSIPCYYRASREVKMGDFEVAKYSKFLSNINKLTGILAHGAHAALNVQSLYKVSKVFPLILPSFFVNEKVVIRERKQPFKFGIVGRLVKGKRVEDTIYAFNELLKKTKEVMLCIIGTGDELKALKEIVSGYDLNDKVHFLGYKSGAQLLSVYKTMDALIISSESESGPLCGLEAIDLSIPVITTKVGLMPEVLDSDYPLFYQIGDTQELVVKMELVLNSPNRNFQQVLNGAKARISMSNAKQQLLKII